MQKPIEENFPRWALRLLVVAIQFHTAANDIGFQPTHPDGILEVAAVAEIF